MDGIINVLKPPGMTSSDVVVRLRRILGTKKIGHTGTLDTGAAGVLPICVGKGTRIAEFITEQGKAYRAEVTFGLATDTQDAFGSVVSRITPDIEPEDVKRIIPGFLGKVKQMPPMYSAVRQKGKHLYEYARQGITLERNSREIWIYRLDLLRWYSGVYPKAIIDVECSKGTYIRTVSHDLGQALGCGAHMSFLLRTRSGPFVLEKSLTLEEIEESAVKASFDFLLPLTAGMDFPQVTLSAGRAAAFRHGLPTKHDFLQEQLKELPFGYVQVMENETLLGIGVWREDGLFPYKVLN